MFTSFIYFLAFRSLQYRWHESADAIVGATIEEKNQSSMFESPR